MDTRLALVGEIDRGSGIASCAYSFFLDTYSRVTSHPREFAVRPEKSRFCKLISQLAQLGKEKGQDALRSALDKEDKGRINLVGTTGNQIAVARKRQQG
jgi:hypothetical protein